MNIFIADKNSFKAEESASRRKVELSSFTEIKINGSHKKGPVPVEVSYKWGFKYESPYLDKEVIRNHTCSFKKLSR